MVEFIVFCTCLTYFNDTYVHRNTVRYTNAGLFDGISLVALMALAVVRSRCVDTVSIDAWITHTLIHIWGKDRKSVV